MKHSTTRNAEIHHTIEDAKKELLEHVTKLRDELSNFIERENKE